jgi:hypothetical protein
MVNINDEDMHSWESVNRELQADSIISSDQIASSTQCLRKLILGNVGQDLSVMRPKLARAPS